MAGMPHRRGASARQLAAVALAALLALFAASTAAELASSASVGPTAAAAKKKGKKDKKKAKKFLQNSIWTNVTSSSVTGASSTTKLQFCPSGRYAYRKDNDSIVAASTTTFDGNWTVKAANPKKGTAKVKYTVQNFLSQYFDGSPGPDSPPPSPSTLNIAAASANQVFFDGIEFTRGGGSC